MTKPDGVLPHPLQPPTPLHIPTHPPLPPPPRTEQPCRPASRSSRWAPWPLLPSAPSKRHGMTTRQAIHAHRIGHPTYPLTPNPACPLLTHSARYSGVPTAGFVTPFRHIALSECPTLSLCQTDLGECDDQEEGGARMHTTLNPNPPYPCHRDSRRRTAVLLARRQGTYCSFSLRPITHQVFEPPPPPPKSRKNRSSPSSKRTYGRSTRPTPAASFLLCQPRAWGPRAGAWTRAWAALS